MQPVRYKRPTEIESSRHSQKSMLAALIQAVERLPAQPPPEIQSLAQIGGAVSGADLVELRFVDANDPVTFATSPNDESPAGTEVPDSIRNEFSNRLVRENRPVILTASDIGKETDAAADSDYRFRSFMGMPLRGRQSGRPAATWCAYRTGQATFTSADLNLWTVIGWRVGWELDAMAEADYDPETVERLLQVRKIGHSINNQLMVASIAAEILGNSDYPGPDDVDLVEDLAAAAETIKRLVNELRSVAAGNPDGVL